MNEHNVSVKEKLRAIVLTADKFEDMEVFFPVFRLMEAGWQVDIAAPKKEEINGEKWVFFNA